ncbi:RagB/SusD family nutrient uptake outer membrane protein [Euzebyella marina]|uniref:RagB/SusD family nutrient uptake outer membrane protein n=1 Tax=Euzebyella marina TaxID=1761453 RepID=A0A3G2L182_9FLAO|nr:RagB/SusD family nutrient uptake outer membrane protein [Euzebyella marina]AYN66012.1 RagB/SusD family nutrient uptake outer membrane protein [Euzebyella marina]
MKNQYKYLVPFVVAICLVQSCDDEILETTPYGQYTSAEFWRNAEDAEAAANAMYQPLRWEDLYGHSENVFDNSSDDLFRAGDHGYETAMENFTFDASNNGFRYGWTAKYEMIARANAVLINVPNIEMDATLKNRILGEAHFIRAFAYWRFSVIYGSVPIVLEQNVIDNNFNIAKSSIEEVRSQVESDLLKAIDYLPESYSGDDIGRASQGTAYGLLAKLYLYEEDFAAAISAGEAIINGPYALAGNYRDNFEVASENNPEMLFAAQGLDGWADVPKTYDAPRPWGGWDFHNPVEDIVNEYETDDPRLGYSILRPGDMIERGGEFGTVEFTADLSQTGYSLTKYWSFNTDDGTINRDHNVPILRAADVYLIVAEAKIRQDGPGAGDSEINIVRNRVGLDPVSNAGMPELIHERRVELFGENQRHQDLMRWDKAGIVDIVSIYGEDRGQFDPPRTFEKPKHYYFPLPQSEIDKSEGILIQNEDY